MFFFLLSRRISLLRHTSSTLDRFPLSASERESEQVLLPLFTMSYSPPRPRTLADVVSFSSDAQAASRALVCCSGGPTLSRAALSSAVADAAASLRLLGVAPGDVVTIVDVNTVRRSAGISVVVKLD